MHGHTKHCGRRNHRPGGVRGTNHSIDLFLGEDSLNSERIWFVHFNPLLGGIEYAQNTLIQCLSRLGSGDTDVHEVGFAVGGHIEHGDAAAGQTRVDTHNACGTGYARLGGERVVFAHPVSPYAVVGCPLRLRWGCAQIEYGARLTARVCGVCPGTRAFCAYSASSWAITSAETFALE